jgi:5-aminolevulinate synthase
LEQEGHQHSIDIINGTLSKAVGVFGGYIAASAIIVLEQEG